MTKRKCGEILPLLNGPLTALGMALWGSERKAADWVGCQLVESLGGAMYSTQH